MILIDASVALKWFLAEEGAERAELLSAEHDVCAPDLIVSEVTNGLWKAVRRRAMSAEDAAIAAGTLEARFAELFPTIELAHRATELACELDHPAYDCFYLAVAAQTGLKLVTDDKRLLGKIEATPFADRCVAFGDWQV